MTAAVIAANSTDQSPPVSRPQANVVATIVLELVQPPVVSRDFLDEHRLSTADEPRSAVRRTQRYPILVVPPSETGCNRPREVHRREPQSSRIHGGLDVGNAISVRGACWSGH